MAREWTSEELFSGLENPVQLLVSGRGPLELGALRGLVASGISIPHSVVLDLFGLYFVVPRQCSSLLKNHYLTPG